MKGTAVYQIEKAKGLNLILRILSDRGIQFEITVRKKATQNVRLIHKGKVLSVIIPYSENKSLYLKISDSVPEDTLIEIKNVVKLWNAGYPFIQEEFIDGLILESLKMVSPEQFLTKVCNDMLKYLPGTWICGYLFKKSFVQLVSCLKKNGAEIIPLTDGEKRRFSESNLLDLSPFKGFSWGEIKEITRSQTEGILSLAEIEEDINLSANTQKSLLIPLVSDQEKVGFLIFGGIPKSLVGATSYRLSPTLPLITDMLRQLNRLNAVREAGKIGRSMKELIKLSLQGASPTEIANEALRIGLKYSGGFKGAISIKHGKYLHLIAQHNFSEEYLRKFKVIKVGDHVVGKVAKYNKCLIIQDSLSSPDSTPEVVNSEGYRSLIAIPLTARGEVQGVMGVLFDRPFAVTGEIEENLRVLGTVAGLALRHALVSEYQLKRIQLLESIGDAHKALIGITSLSELTRNVKELLSKYNQFTDIHFFQVHFQNTKKFLLEDPLTGKVEGPFRLHRVLVPYQ